MENQMKCHTVVGPAAIGNIKNKRREGRDFLAHTQGDAHSVIFAAGNNFYLLLNWLRNLLCLFLRALFSLKKLQSVLNWSSSQLTLLSICRQIGMTRLL